VAIVKVTWLPPPSRIAWLATSSLGACALLAALVLIPSLRRFSTAMALIAAVACLVGSGTSRFRVAASALAVLVVLVAMLLGNRLRPGVRQWLPVTAAAVMVVLAVTHFEVFEHQLLAGWAPDVLQRISITVALAFAAAVVGSELVTSLGATAALEPATGEPVTLEQ
jgi:hypothetical protein